MRENGLRAAAYVAVADLHPQLADLMLDALADEGVAAYASPPPSASGRGLTMPTQLPAGPVDRLWVDRDATATARRVLDDRLPELRAELERASTDSAPTRPERPRDPDTTPGGVLVDDDTWAAIIASYRAESATGPARSDPVRPDASSRSSADGPPDAWPEEARASIGNSLVRPADDPADHYEPPPPPPLPTADTTTRMAWAGVIGGPLLFLLSVFLEWNLSDLAKLAGVAAMVVGFVTLVARMRDGGDDNDPDNGAVV